MISSNVILAIENHSRERPLGIPMGNGLDGANWDGKTCSLWLIPWAEDAGLQEMELVS